MYVEELLYNFGFYIITKAKKYQHLSFCEPIQ